MVGEQSHDPGGEEPEVPGRAGAGRWAVIPTWRTEAAYLKDMQRLKLSKPEFLRVTTVMTRYAQGRAMPRDHGYLRDGVEELRVSGDRRTFRIYFGRVEGGLVLLCLNFTSKKKQRDDVAIDLAAQRLKRYR